jgi:hypothetical protein
MLTIDATREQMSHAEVLAAVKRLAAQGREVLADLLALLAVLDERRLYEADGCASLYVFCVERLRLSESQAYHRIQAARAARRFPVILDRLREGRVTLTAVALLRPHLTEANHLRVLDWAEGKPKPEVGLFIRTLAPLPDVRASLRRLASPPGAAPATGPARDYEAGRTRAGAEEAADAAAPAAGAVPGPRRASMGLEADAIEDSSGLPLATALGPVGPRPARAEVRPLSPARYSLHVTISEETRDKLRRAQDLLQHTLPAADPAAVLDRALTLLVEHLERRKFAALNTPQNPSAPTRTRRGRRSGAPAGEPRRALAAQAPPPDRTAASTPPPDATPPRAATPRAAAASPPPRAAVAIPLHPRGGPARRLDPRSGALRLRGRRRRPVCRDGAPRVSPSSAVRRRGRVDARERGAAVYST